VSYVIPLLNDSSSVIRSRAAIVLWRIPDERINDALMNNYYDPDFSVRRSIIFALYQRNCEEAAPLYFEAVRDSHYIVRSYGVTALGRLSGSKATEYIEEALSDDSSDVQTAALLALRHRTRPSQVDLAKRFLYSEDRHLLRSALSLFSRLGADGYIDHERHADIIQRLVFLANHSNYDLTRSKSIRILGQIKAPELTRMLPDLLKDRDSSVRTTAAEVIAKFGYRGFTFPLKAALEKETNDHTLFWIKKALETLEAD
jgi:HEAT repeat protein